MLYNCHVHSHHSHDSAADVNQMCAAAIEKGLTGIAITDHCDCEFAVQDHVFDRIAGSVKDAVSAANIFKNDLTVLRGVELGDALFDPAFAKKITDAFDFDITLLSVHAVRASENPSPFSGIDFSFWKENELHTYLTQYFAELEKSVERFDFDVLSHLTVPIRYIRYKYQRSVEILPYREQITRILQRLISLDKALELNTQGAAEKTPFFLPDEVILDLYFQLGGQKIVLGSDAHSPAQIAAGLTAGKNFLLTMGIKKAFYYRKHHPVAYDLE